VWAGGTFFPVVLLCCVSILFWWEMRELALHYFPADCFGIEREIVLVLRTYLVSNTVVQLCQFFCCGGKLNFVRIPYSHDRFSKILRTFFVKKMIPYETYVREDQLFLALYASTTIQSLLFLKNIKNFVWFPKQYLLGFFILEKQLANISDRGFLFLRDTILLYSLLLWRESLFSTVYTLLLYSLDPYSWTE
jgi:hypothetical protein